MNLVLGTVRFGMPYGVFSANPPTREYCIKCMDWATQNGITAIDTASAYGYAEELVGDFLKRKTIERGELAITTKLLPNVLDEVPSEFYGKVIRENLIESLKKLGTDYVDTYFLHSSRYVYNDLILEALEKVKHEGLAKNVGASLYYPDEVAQCISSGYIDSVQVPYSIFDHRMKTSGALESVEKSGHKVDVRSAFLKGVIRLKDSDIPKYLEKTRPILKRLDELCVKYGYTRIEMALSYIKRERNIRSIVVGVSSMEQLMEDVGAFRLNVPETVLMEIDKEFDNIDQDIVIPSLWVR